MIASDRNTLPRPGLGLPERGGAPLYTDIEFGLREVLNTLALFDRWLLLQVDPMPHDQHDRVMLGMMAMMQTAERLCHLAITMDAGRTEDAARRRCNGYGKVIELLAQQRGYVHRQLRQRQPGLGLEPELRDLLQRLGHGASQVLPTPMGPAS